MTDDELTEVIEHDDVACHGDAAKMAREILALRALAIRKNARVAELSAQADDWARRGWPRVQEIDALRTRLAAAERLAEAALEWYRSHACADHESPYPECPECAGFDESDFPLIARIDEWQADRSHRRRDRGER